VPFEVGDRVVAEKSGRRKRTATQGLRAPRHGVIEEVLRGDPRPRYRIRWSVGEVSVFSPANGGLQADPDFTPSGKRKPASKRKTS
jgi:hypothetical protein